MVVVAAAAAVYHGTARRKELAAHHAGIRKLIICVAQATPVEAPSRDQNARHLAAKMDKKKAGQRS